MAAKKTPPHKITFTKRDGTPVSFKGTKKTAAKSGQKGR